MKIRLTIILLLFFLINENIDATNYQKGDTLHVVALSGSVLRKGPNTSSKKLGKIDCKSKVEILNTFDFKNHKDTIEGFVGNWVFVKSEVGVGYVFDTFISTLPLVGSLDWYNSDSMGKDFGAAWEMFPSLIKEYAFKRLKKEECEFYYEFQPEGEAAHHFEIHQLENEHQFIDHFYWEGYGAELELTNTRECEVYYLIRHLLLPVEKAWENKQYPLRLPQDGFEFIECFGLYENKCGFRVSKKNKNKIAVFFEFIT